MRPLAARGVEESDKMGKITEKEVWQELKKVKDPEVGHNIVDMGLIYQVRVKNRDRVEIRMTLTSLGCPLGGMIEEKIKNRLQKKFKVKNVKVEFTFDPPWTPEKMTPKLRASLGF